MLLLQTILKHKFKTYYALGFTYGVLVDNRDALLGNRFITSCFTPFKPFVLVLGATTGGLLRTIDSCNEWDARRQGVAYKSVVDIIANEKEEDN